MVDIPLLKESLGTIRKVFISLPSAHCQIQAGFYRAFFIGPWWLRLTAMPSIALSGLKGWQGKKFFDQYQATNIVLTKEGLIEKLTMTCKVGTSLVDGEEGVALHYGLEAPVPWRWIKDEIRILDDQTFLCMTVIDLPLLRKLSFPFILRRES